MDLWTDDFKWFVWFLIRSAIYGYILYHAFCFLRRKVPGVLGYGPIRKYPNMRKLRRVKGYFNYRWRRIKRKKKAGIDPIRTAFDGMKDQYLLGYTSKLRNNVRSRAWGAGISCSYRVERCCIVKELKDCIKGLLYLVGVVEHQIRVFRTDGYR
nr:unnamed protein product [Gossypium raimondii]XP_012466058.1 unnamed protein product [Gossypium raimondii]